MIDRLRSVVSVQRLQPLEEFLTSTAEEMESVDRSLDEHSDVDSNGPPEEHIIELLAHNGGRMWQQGIVSETGYSEARVSRLLCKLEKHDIVNRHWSGGEKVVILDRDPTEVPQSELLSST